MAEELSRPLVNDYDLYSTFSGDFIIRYLEYMYFVLGISEVKMNENRSIFHEQADI